jgi:hypothetical protein
MQATGVLDKYAIRASNSDDEQGRARTRHASCCKHHQRSGGAMRFRNQILLRLSSSLSLAWIALAVQATAAENGVRPGEPAQAAIAHKNDKLPKGALLRLQLERDADPESTRTAIRSVAFFGDGKSIAVGNHEGIGLWDVSTGKFEKMLYRGEFGVSTGDSLIFSPEGKHFFLGRNSQVERYETATGKLLGRVIETNGYIESFALSPDGKTLAAPVGSIFTLLAPVYMCGISATARSVSTWEGLKRVPSHSPATAKCWPPFIETESPSGM